MAHPLPEVLFLVVCGSIASCDDFDDIAAWGEAHLDFLRRFLPFEHGVPGERWLNILMNRIDLVNGRVTGHLKTVDISLFADNIGDSHGVSSGANLGALQNYLVTPRTVGITFDYKM